MLFYLQSLDQMELKLKILGIDTFDMILLKYVTCSLIISFKDSRNNIGKNFAINNLTLYIGCMIFRCSKFLFFSNRLFRIVLIPGRLFYITRNYYCAGIFLFITSYLFSDFAFLPTSLQ